MKVTKEWLQYLKKINGKCAELSATRTLTPDVEANLLPISPDDLYEMYANLVMAGFDKEEALYLVALIIKDVK